MSVNELFNLNDLEEGGGQDKLIFPDNINTKMRITEVSEGVLEKSGYPYYVLRCTVLDGEHEGKEYDIFVNTKYKTKDGTEKGARTFKQVLGGLCKGFASLEISEGRGDDLPETFKTQIDRIIGHDIEVAFFKEENGYQNLIYLRDLTAKETTKETTTEKKENF